MKKTILLCRDEHRFVPFDIAKVRQEFGESKKCRNFFVKLLRQTMCFTTKREYRGDCCREEIVI